MAEKGVLVSLLPVDYVGTRRTSPRVLGPAEPGPSPHGSPGAWDRLQVCSPVRCVNPSNTAPATLMTRSRSQSCFVSPLCLHASVWPDRLAGSADAALGVRPPRTGTFQRNVVDGRRTVGSWPRSTVQERARPRPLPSSRTKAGSLPGTCSVPDGAVSFLEGSFVPPVAGLPRAAPLGEKWSVWSSLF